MFAPAAGIAYLDSATYGLPPDATLVAMREALSAWQGGTADWIEDWDRVGERARTAFGRLVGTDPANVANIPAVSVGVGMIAASLTSADDVVVPSDEFTSVLFPLLVARERGVSVREVPLEGLEEAIRPGTTLVAFSLVQMQTGRLARLGAVLDRAASVGARTLVDATQGVPLIPLGTAIDRIDYLVAAAYKHLLCPRGVAFMTISAEGRGEIPPILANWRAADRPYGRFFGGPLTLADDAARFDVSLAWLPWIGAAASLELLATWSAAGALREPLVLAERLAGLLGLPWGGGPLVCAPIRDREGAQAALAAARVRAAVRGDAIRMSTHVYTSDEDIVRAADALRPFVRA